MFQHYSPLCPIMTARCSGVFPEERGEKKKQNLCTAFKNNKNKRETSKSILPLGLSQLEWIRCLIWEAAFAKLQMIW